MRIFTINLGNYGSTGKIVREIGETAVSVGHIYKSAYPQYPRHRESDASDYTFGNRVSFSLHYRLAYHFGFSEYYSVINTLRLVREIKRFSPDIIHLHNLHGWFLNIPILFGFLRRSNIRIVWTLHDCWAFTGHCPYFTLIGCDKWKTGCYDCPQYREYPMSNVDTSRYLYKKKKQWFSGLPNLTIVTPSEWLAGLVRQSFLRDYPIKVINNGIDLSVFKPVPSDFRKKYHCEDKYILLGVAFDWGKRKGLDMFIELARRLDASYQIVLVGTDENIDKQLPSNIISVHRTQNQQELAEIYAAADIFVNPTREENFPTVNIEALACGTPVLTFRTGGSPEIIDETCGYVVERDDVDGVEHEIMRICETMPYSKEACIKRATIFDMNDRFEEYVKLYQSIMGEPDEVKN